MKKILKVISIIAAALILLQLSVFCMARWGWKLWGFNMCETPKILCIETVSVTDKNIHIAGNTSSSATAYVGYTYEIKDNALYIGIKQNLLFGFNERRGDYSFSIEGDFENIEAVFLKDKNEEKCIWSKEAYDKNNI